MKSSFHCVISMIGLAMLLGGCATMPATEESRDSLIEQSTSALQRLQNEDPSLNRFLDDAYGYAIFPSVGKGGLIAGGAYGRGVVYEQGDFIGFADISQVTVGAQAGGQTFSELIVFENQAALNRFTSGDFAFAANASAVALKTGAGAAARYSDGVAVFIEPVGGLMVEAAVGGQQFTFERIASAGDQQ